MSARLLIEVVGSDAAPVELPRSGVLSVGSSRERADLVVEGQGVADVHCAIGRVKGGGWAIKDLGSEYGTIVGGVPVQSTRLQAGDQIVVGSRRLRIVAAPAPPPGPEGQGARRPEEAELAPEPADPEEAPPPSPPPPPSRLPQIPGYRVEKPLGRGGMGAVFLAVQESLERRVALKILNPGLAADADFVGRFLAEARAAAALSHPNVVTVHDVWEDAGRHLLSMEYMERGNLETRVVREGRLPPAEVLQILTDAAKGLVFAEVRGIVHRDIKPANLMQDELGHTKIADLGLATHLEAEAQDEGSGKKIFGTPHFISPEQARGERVDCRSDLYSLGATCYRLLTGHTPFEGATTRDILRGHFTGTPLPVRERANDVPEELARIVHRLLEKDPEARFPSASVLLQETERLRAGAAAPSLAPSRRGRKGPLIAAAAAATLLIAIVAGLRILGGAPGEDDGVIAGGTQVDPASPIDSGYEADDERETPAAGGTKPVEPAVDDDTALKRLELDAREAWLLWRERSGELPLEERRGTLLELSTQYGGTTAAGEMRTEVRRLEALIQAETRRERRLGDAADAALERLREAAAPGGEPLPLGSALAAMLALTVERPLLSDADFQEARTDVFRDVVKARHEAARTRLARIDELAALGRFDEVEAELNGLVTELELPEAEELSFGAIPELGDLNGMRSLAVKRIAGLDRERERHRTELERADALTVAAAFGGQAGLESELRALSFAEADARLGALESELRSEEARGFVTSLRADLAAGRAALERLGRDFNGWRRKAVDDPRDRSRSAPDAVGADANGVKLAVGGGAEQVPWSSFGGNAEALHQLFYGRLDRDYGGYDAEQLAGIAALLRLTAVVHALAEASEMLEGGGGAHLTDDEMAGMLSGFELARGWARTTGRETDLERELRATRLLAHSLRAAGRDAWSSAVADLERLLAEYRDTLLVHLVSDGRPWRPAPELPADEPEAAEPEAGEPEEGPGDDGAPGGED